MPPVGGMVALNGVTPWAPDKPVEPMDKALFMLVIACGILTVDTFPIRVSYLILIPGSAPPSGLRMKMS